MGYSINDTVVVFDRLRENLMKYKTMPLRDVMNLSVNETLSRTLMTSVTTLIALGALLIFGGDVIRGFAFAIFLGVVLGTYSSVYVAKNIVLLHRAGPQRQAEGQRRQRIRQYRRLKADAADRDHLWHGAADRRLWAGLLSGRRPGAARAVPDHALGCRAPGAGWTDTAAPLALAGRIDVLFVGMGAEIAHVPRSVPRRRWKRPGSGSR